MARVALFFNVLEEANRMDIRVRRNMQRMIRYNTRALEMDSEEFRRNYRLSKELYDVLVEDLTPLMKQTIRRSDISVLLQDFGCIVILRYWQLPKNSSKKKWYGNVSTVRIKSYKRSHRDILTKYIKFPQTAEERNVIKRKFYEKFHIPSVEGCIDGTHVAIIRPTEHEERYFNRKHYHSRNVQIICDSNMNILSVDATFGGATHDSFIFNQHPVKAHLLELKSRDETVYLLGDSGYAQRAYMMTPVLNAEAGSPEEHYTQRHCSARNTVERTIGLLKARWRCLLRHRVLHYDPQNAAKIINACCVLL